MSIAEGILSCLHKEVSEREAILLANHLVVFAKVLVIVSRSGEESRPGVARGIGQGNDGILLAPLKMVAAVGSSRALGIQFSVGTCAVRGAIRSIHLRLGARACRP